jgi:hypothetical protein
LGAPNAEATQHDRVTEEHLVRHLPDLVTRHRAIGLLAVGALLVTTCTGGPQTTTVEGDHVAVSTPAPLPQSEAITLPVQGDELALGALAGEPAATPTLEGLGAADEPTDTDVTEVPDPAADLPEQVDLVEPDLLLRAGEGATFDPDDLAAVDEHGVSHFAAVTEFAIEGASVDGEEADLTAMAVDVDDFRPLTPDVTAQTVGVWERLLDGDVLVRHDVAHELGLELGGTMILRTDDGTTPVRIGAFAANGAPPLADLLVPRQVGALLGVSGSNTLVVAADEAPAEDVADALAATLGGDAELLEAPAPQKSAPKTTGSVTLEPFNYTSRGDGTIKIDPAWVQRNIVTTEIPGLGRTQCHRAMVPQLMEALREVHEAGLYGHFKPEQFAGCFMPRHILWNPSNGLSMHAWGLAIDFNAVDNAFGKRPVMDPRIVEIFKRWGFEWGGDWSTPDGMHFQLKRIVETP